MYDDASDDDSSSSSSESDGEVAAPIVYSSSEDEIEFDLSTEKGREARAKYKLNQQAKREIREKQREETNKEAATKMAEKKAAKTTKTKSPTTTTAATTTTTSSDTFNTRPKGLGSLSCMGFNSNSQPQQVSERAIKQSRASAASTKNNVMGSFCSKSNGIA